MAKKLFQAGGWGVNGNILNAHFDNFTAYFWIFNIFLRTQTITTLANVLQHVCVGILLLFINVNTQHGGRKPGDIAYIITGTKTYYKLKNPRIMQLKRHFDCS